MGKGSFTSEGKTRVVPQLKDVPNLLTISRVLLIPVFVVLLVEPTALMRYWAIGIFLLAACTDFVDGYLARRWSVESDFGKLVDPLADKLLVMSALVMMVSQRAGVEGNPLVPGWLVVMVLAREMWVTGLRGWAAKLGLVVAASQAGKLKSFLQMTAIPLLFLFDVEFEVGSRVLSLHIFGMQFFVLSVLISYWGAIEYTYEVFSLAKAGEDSGN